MKRAMVRSGVMYFFLSVPWGDGAYGYSNRNSRKVAKRCKDFHKTHCGISGAQQIDWRADVISSSGDGRDGFMLRGKMDSHQHP